MLKLAALLLAAAQPAPDPLAYADEVMEVFESVCLKGGKAPAGFETTAWSEFPEPLKLMNTYDHAGTFLRRSDRSMYIAETRGPGHMMPGIETRCGVAAQGIDKAAIVDRLTKLAQADKSPEVTMGEMKMTMIFGKGGAFTVYDSEDRWVIVRSMGLMIPADSVPRRYRKKKKGD